MIVRSLIALLAAAALAAASRTPSSADDASATVARGQYLVTRASLCIDCHGVDLKGAPSHGSGPPSGPWAKAAPAIAGLPMFAKDADAMQFLETGKLPDGASARPPMPQYRLDAADAAAVVAYLHSVK